MALWETPSRRRFILIHMRMCDMLTKQCQFIEETAGKISIDEDAINTLRMGCAVRI